MRNRYPGICYQCGLMVAKGDGHFERGPQGWKVHHASCALIKKLRAGYCKERLIYKLNEDAVAIARNMTLETGKKHESYLCDSIKHFHVMRIEK